MHIKQPPRGTGRVLMRAQHSGVRRARLRACVGAGTGADADADAADGLSPVVSLVDLRFGAGAGVGVGAATAGVAA